MCPLGETDVSYEVPLVPQPTGVSCWAAALAMVVDTRDQVNYPVQRLFMHRSNLSNVVRCGDGLGGYGPVELEKRCVDKSRHYRRMEPDPQRAISQAGSLFKRGQGECGFPQRTRFLSMSSTSSNDGATDGKTIQI